MDDLEQAGLIGECYDSILHVRQKLRKINDIPLPRNGVTGAQFGTFFGVLFVVGFFYALIISPIFRLTGVHLKWYFILIIIFGPPIFASQRVVKPMPHGKSIPGTMLSLWRDFTDDPTHARGRPTSVPKWETVDGPVLHFQRIWVPNAHAAEPEETDARTEALLAGFYPDTEQWALDKAQEHARIHNEKLQEKKNKDTESLTTRSRGDEVEFV